MNYSGVGVFLFILVIFNFNAFIVTLEGYILTPASKIVYNFIFYLNQNYVKFNVQIFYDIRLVVKDLKNSKPACRHRDDACK